MPVPKPAPRYTLSLARLSAVALLGFACSGGDGEEAAADAGAPSGGEGGAGGTRSGEGGAGETGGGAGVGGIANTPDASGPEMPGWQALDLGSAGRVRDIVALHEGEAPAAILASDQGLFRLDAAGVTALDAPEVAGGYAAVDVSPTRGLFAISEDGKTMIMGPTGGPFQRTVFPDATAYLELVASPTGFLALRSADTVSIYEHFEGIGVAGVAGVRGPYLAAMPEGPKHLAAGADDLYAFDLDGGEVLSLPDGTALGGVTTLHLTADGNVFGGDSTGRIVERVGGEWRRLDAPVASGIRGGDAGPAGVVLVGDRGLVLRRTGDDWAPIDMPRADDLVDAAATPGEPLLLTTDGEVLWYGLPSAAPGAGGDTPDPPDRPDGGLPDAGPPPPPAPQMRVLSLFDVAVMNACLDRQPVEGPYDRAGGRFGGQIASGYLPISAGEHRFATEVYSGPGSVCNGFSEETRFTARPGILYTALLWKVVYNLLGPEVAESAFPPVDGLTRLRAFGKSETRSVRLQICIDGEPLPPDFGVVDRPAFVAEIRMESAVHCQGELLGTAPVEVTPGASSTVIAYSIGTREEDSHVLMTCLDVAPDGTLATDGSCREVPVTAP
jgi:hypothetical protein